MGITLEVSGECVVEIATVKSIECNNASALKPGDVAMRIDPRYFRPTGEDTLLGVVAKANEKSG